MKKILIVLMLFASLVIPCAQAENAAPYAPGSVTEDLFAEAFDRGDMLALDMSFDLSFAENAGELWNTDAELLNAVCEVLEHSAFTVGAAKIDGGLRVMLAGNYTVDDQSAALDGTLDLTLDGISLTSSAIPGERFSAKWETLLSLAGASEEEIASIMSLRDADWETLLSELLVQLQPMVELAAQIAAPYGETIMAHIAALPMVVNENVPAENGYPAAASEVQVQITAKALGDLIIALSEQLKQDATLCALLDMALAETATPDSPALTTVELCDIIIQAANEELTDETMPLNIFAGMDAAGNPLYFSIVEENQDGTYFTISLIMGKLEETEADLFNLDILSLSAEQDIIDGVSFILVSDVDEANPNVMSMELLLSSYVDGVETLAFGFYTDNDSADFEGYPGYVGAMTMELHALGGETAVSANMAADITSVKTANDSEEVVVVGSMTTTAEGEEIPMTFEGSVLTEVIDGMPVTTMTESVQMPGYGVSEWAENYTLYTLPQRADSLTETTLETASAQELEALAGRAMEAIEANVELLFKLLPPQLLDAGEEAVLPAQP